MPSKNNVSVACLSIEVRDPRGEGREEGEGEKQEEGREYIVVARERASTRGQRR